MAEAPVPELIDDEALEATSVVANNAMNRERGLRGENSYADEIGFDPVGRLLEYTRGANGERVVSWLDLCCGRGRALIQSASALAERKASDPVRLVGVDLVDFFDPVPSPSPVVSLDLVCASVGRWQPNETFDLITCVHGLHYVGDKLALLARAASWLSDDGAFIADFELDSVRAEDGEPLGRPLTAALRRAGFSLDTRRHRISREGRADVELPFEYLGADSNAGPNYTGQPAVHSYYRA